MFGVESYSPGFLAKSKGKIAQNEQKTRKTEENEQKSEVFPPFFSLIRFFLLILHPNNKSVINMKTNFRPAYIKDFAACWKVIDQARQSMIESGRHQWTEEYPSEKDKIGRAHV